MSDIPLGHSGIPTTTGQPAVAPENLLTRGYAKRSLAALETEFVESNDINAMAPSSAVLQSDYLIMDDAHYLDDKVDMSDSMAPSSTSSITAGPAAKRPRYTAADHGSAAVSEADFAQLKPVIQPRAGSKSPSSGGDHATITVAKSTTTTRPRASSLSWARSVSDLVPPSTQLAPICLDEEGAAKVLGKPMDSSSAKFSSLGGESQPSRMDIDSEADRSSDGQHRNTTGSSSPGASSSSSSSLFVPSHQSHGGQPMEHRRSISGASSSSTHQGASSTFGHGRKGTQPRPVLIKIIDEKESESIRERAKRDSITQGLNDTELDDLKQAEKDEDEELVSGKMHDQESDGDVALPKEDPMLHDWDREELDDETDTSAATSNASSPAPMSQRRRSIESDIRRASGHASNSQPSSLRTSHSRESRRKRKDNDDNDDDDDDRDSLLDPEREVAVMSEDQEAELHNMHLRLENQREFQDAAGLDLGEEDAQAVNEDGQYGGILEDDDEGEDYWENR